MRGIVLIASLCLVHITGVLAWDSLDLQMFDLVEELQTSFYEYLGVNKNASNNEIRRAYRKLSVSMHPDKNVGDDTADAKFRQLVGIYEILKDEEARRRYDDVLENGLPDWKTPVFYYRQLRKMSNLELFIIFSVLCTVVHYAVLWGVRFEKSLTLEDKLSTALKRHKARDRKREQIDLQISEELGKIPKPKWHDLLPFAICKGIYAFIRFLPVLLSFFKGQISEKIEERRQLNRELIEELEQKEKLKLEKQERKRRVVGSRAEPEISASDVYGGLFNLSDIPPDISSNESANSSPKVPAKTNREWTDEDITNLVNAVARYPGGVPGRWERIAEQLDRTVSEVSKKAKELGAKKLRSVFEQNQMSYEIPSFETNENPVCGESSSDNEDQDEYTTSVAPAFHQTANRSSPTVSVPGDDRSDDAIQDQTETVTVDDTPYLSRKKQKEHLKMASRKPDDSELAAQDTSDGWTQLEQKQLEVAIRSIPKGTPERWDRIADCVPSKTKAEVMNRVKHLSTMVKVKSKRA